jgi:hypothetical protein
MAIKAHGLATKIDTAAGTVTLSMLNRNDVAVVEHTLSLDAALGILTFILQAMDDAGMLDDDEDLSHETEVVGHC